MSSSKNRQPIGRRAVNPDCLNRTTRLVWDRSTGDHSIIWFAAWPCPKSGQVGGVENPNGWGPWASTPKLRDASLRMAKWRVVAWLSTAPQRLHSTLTLETLERHLFQERPKMP